MHGASENEATAEPSPSTAPNVAVSALDASVALASLAILEGALQPGGIDLAPAAMGGALGLLVGLVLGALWNCIGRLRPAARAIAWCVGGAGLGLWPALAIGAIPKLSGPHRSMAVASLAGGILFGASAGAVTALVQQSDARSRARTRVTAIILVASALGAAGAVEVTDDTLLVLRSYPPLRVALAVIAGLAAAVAGISVGAALRASRRIDSGGGIWAALWLAALTLGLVASARLPAERAARLTERPISGRLISIARTMTDFDHDGASGWFGGGDCAPFDARVSPRAREIPGNGVDDNCRFGDAKPRGFLSNDAPVPAEPSPVDVVVVTIDSLRADHLGSYGYGRPTSPRIDAFGRGAMRFTRAYTSGGWTCLALPSMLSGLYPRRLDWKAVAITSSDRMLPFPWDGALAPGETWLATLSSPVRMPSATIPRWLARRGMRTAAVLTSKSAAILRYGRLSEDNFDTVIDLPDGDDAQAIDRAIAFIDSAATSPFFLWVHLYEPHEPYAQHPGIVAFGDRLEDVYDHDVAFTDREFGRLVDALDARHGRPAGLVLTADHGESFIGGLPVHGVDLREEILKIPLFVRGPGAAPGTTDAPVSLVDVAPTVFEWTRTPLPAGLDGVSLLHPAARRTPISDVWRHDRSGRVYIDMSGITGESRRLVVDHMLNASFVYSAGDASRPPRLLDEPADPELTNALGRYEEESGTLE